MTGRLDPAPPARLALARIGVGLYGTIYLLLRAPELARLAALPAESFDPVGPLRVLDAPLPGAVLLALLVLGVLSGLLVVRGWRHRISGPVFALSLLALMSYRSSFGMVFHTDNLLVFHAGILALTPAASALAPGRPVDPEASPDHRWPLVALGLATTLAYLLAGIAKLRGLGWAWTEGEVLMGHVAYDALRKLSVGGGYSPFGVFLILEVPWVFAPLASFSLLIEIGAPLALVHRKVGWVWCGAAWLFHLGVWAMMLIGFPYYLTGVAYLSFLPTERLLAVPWVRGALARTTGAEKVGPRRSTSPPLSSA